MNNINTYNLNKQIVAEKYPYLVDNLDTQDKEDIEIDIINAKDGNKSMLLKKNERQVYINSKYKPLDEAKKWAESINIKKNSIIVVFGFGLGHRLKEIAKRLSNEGMLIVIEPNKSIFQNALKQIDLIDILNKNNIYLIVGEEEKEYKEQLWQLINWANVRNAIISNIPNYDKLFNEQYLSFVKSINDLLFIRKSENDTYYHSNKRWTINFFENIPYILQSINSKELFRQFEEKPAIIVSAGPSLNKNVKLLKEIKDKAVIICVGTALRTLLKENIKPDLVIMIEGFPSGKRILQGINYDDIPLVYKTLVYPDVLKDHKGTKIVFSNTDIYAGENFNRYASDIGYIPGGGSVAHNAFNLAINIGANPIILIGQDLAYSDGKTHADGTVYQNNKINIDNKINKLIRVEDIDGKEVLSKPEWYVFLKWFEKEIEKDNSQKIYIDATEGGAKINGTKVMKLRDVIDKYCKEDIATTEKINNIINNAKLLENQKIFEIVNEFKVVEAELKKIINKCKIAIDSCNTLINILSLNKYHDQKRIKKIVDRLKEIDDYIKNQENEFMILKMVIDPVMVEFMSELAEKENNALSKTGQDIDVVKTSKKLYSDIKEAIEYVIPLLNDSIDKMQNII